MVFSITWTLSGEPLPDDPALVALRPDDPIDLVPGFRYVLYLAHDATDETLHVVGPGAWERSPADRQFRRHPDAPDSLPGAVSPDDLAEPGR